MQARHPQADIAGAALLCRTISGAIARRGYRPGGLSCLIVDQSAKQFEFLRQRVVGPGEVLDLAHGVQHRGVIAPAEPAADFRQGPLTRRVR